MLCRFGQLRNSSIFIHFIHLAALLQAVLKAKTEQFPSGLVDTRNRGVKMRKGLGTLLVLVQFFSNWSAVSSDVPFKHGFLNFTIVILSYLMSFFDFFQPSPLLSMFPFRRWQRWETSKSWQLIQQKHKRNILGTASHGTCPFLELTRNITHSFLREWRQSH